MLFFALTFAFSDSWHLFQYRPDTNMRPTWKPWRRVRQTFRADDPWTLEIRHWTKSFIWEARPVQSAAKKCWKMIHQQLGPVTWGQFLATNQPLYFVIALRQDCPRNLQNQLSLRWVLTVVLASIVVALALLVKQRWNEGEGDWRHGDCYSSMMGRMTHKAMKFHMKLGDHVLKQKASERKRTWQSPTNLTSLFTSEDCGPRLIKSGSWSIAYSIYHVSLYISNEKQTLLMRSFAALPIEDIIFHHVLMPSGSWNRGW